MRYALSADTIETTKKKRNIKTNNPLELRLEQEYLDNYLNTITFPSFLRTYSKEM